MDDDMDLDFEDDMLLEEPQKGKEDPNGVKGGEVLSVKEPSPTVKEVVPTKQRERKVARMSTSKPPRSWNRKTEWRRTNFQQAVPERVKDARSIITAIRSIRSHPVQAQRSTVKKNVSRRKCFRCRLFLWKIVSINVYD